MDVPAACTADALRAAFARWGRPGRIRVDNGYPWGSTGGLPTEVELWLAGLGVELVRNPPRRPQANGVVERSQGTAKGWAEPATCGGAAELQGRLDAIDEHYRERFPDPGSSRARLFPALAAGSGRPYEPEAEAERWSPALAYEAASRVAAPRRVNARGLVSIYGRNHYVGRRLAGADILVRLDPATGEWRFERPDGTVIDRAASGITYRAVAGRTLTITHSRRGKPPDAPGGET